MEVVMSNVPKLRFPEFSDKWIPTRAGKYFEQLSGFPFKSEDISEDNSGIPILRGVNITEGRIRHSPEMDRFYLGGIAQYEKYIVQEGDIVLGMDGSKVGKNVAVISSSDSGSLLIQRVARLRDNGIGSLDFIFHHIFSYRFHRYVDVVNTSSGIPHISAKQINDYPINAPSKPEQQKIAAFLTAVDTKIEQLTQKEALLKQYKKGVMQKIFSQEIRFKADDGSEFPEWQEKTLGEVVLSLSNGLSLEQNTEGNGYKVTRIETISNARINLSKVGFVETESDITNYKLNKGDMLFSNINSVQHIGKIAYVERDFDLYHGMNLLRLVISADHDSKYLYYVLTSSWYKRYFERVCNKAVNQASINQADLRKTPLFMPSKREQTKIAHFISVLDEQADKISQQLEAAKTFKKGLLQQMFV
jgi:type I restriction enzyme S subunit